MKIRIDIIDEEDDITVDNIENIEVKNTHKFITALEQFIEEFQGGERK